jgi:peroxiredoxin/glutaredoxin
LLIFSAMALPNKEGQRIPEVTFRLRERGEKKALTTNELFAGRTVIVFALPGAFTPTCSTAHVPRYDELAPLFAAHGIDDIVCLSVNDGFVMEAWKEDQGVEHVRFVADGNGEFTEAMGMLVDKEALGFGKRSWRYSMLVKDGVIDKMFIEPEVEGDPYEVSDADTMLRYIAPQAELPPDILMFTKPGCPHCAKAKALLAERGLVYEELPATPRRLRAVSTAHSTPQIFIDGRRLGGAEDLERHLAEG